MGKVYKPITYLNTKETATPITKPEDVDNIKLHEWFTFNCVKCGKEVIIAKRNDKDRVARYKTLLCQPCYAKHVKLIEYGDENYNNREQAMETINNWTDEQREKDHLRRVQVWENRTEEEKHEIIQKGHDTYKAKTGYGVTFSNPEVQQKVDRLWLNVME